MMRCAIWHHLYNFKNVENTHGGVLILVKLQAEASICFYKWYQIAQRMTHNITSFHKNSFLGEKKIVRNTKYHHSRMQIQFIG